MSCKSYKQYIHRTKNTEANFFLHWKNVTSVITLTPCTLWVYSYSPLSNRTNQQRRKGSFKKCQLIVFSFCNQTKRSSFIYEYGQIAKNKAFLPSDVADWGPKLQQYYRLPEQERSQRCTLSPKMTCC